MSSDDDSNAAPQDPLLGALLGNFRVEQCIAVGGMGLIYRAVHTVIGRQAAIKVLSQRYSRDQNMIKRLHREARAVNRIGHRNIVDIFDFGRTPDGREYFVMEYLGGESLAQIFEQRGPQPWAFSRQVLAQVLDALAAAHDLGIVHRDIKPENVLVMSHEDGTLTTKVLDFGIAKSVGFGPLGEQLTRAGSIMGTPEHIAPEQIRGRQIDGRADLYAVGTVLYEMVSGRRPFEAEQVTELLMMHLRDPIPPLGELPEELGVPADIATVLDTALAKDPKDRFQDARSFARALGLPLSEVSAIDGTRELPEMFWEMHGPQRTNGSDAIADGFAVPTAATRPSVTTTIGPERATSTTAPAVGSRGKSRWRHVWLIAALLGMSAASYWAVAPRLFRRSSPPDPRSTERAMAPQTIPSRTARTEPLRPSELQSLLLKVREALRAELRNPDGEIRRSALRGMGYLGDRDVKSLLIRRLESDPDAGVRAAAALAIARLGHTESIAALIEARSESDPALRVWIDEALLHLGDDRGRRSLELALGSRDPQVRFAAAIALAEVGNAKAEQTLTSFIKTEASTQKLTTALYALARLGNDRALATLRLGIKRSDREVRLHFAETLSLLGDTSAISELNRLMHEDHRQTQLLAAKALATAGDDTGLELMRESLSNADPKIRLLAAIGLGAVSDQVVLRLLAGALDDRDEQVRAAASESAAKVLGMLPGELIDRSQGWLLTALESRDGSMRYAAVGVTSEMDPELAVELLAWAFKDKDDRVRAAAIASLGQLDHRSDKALRVIRAGLGDVSPLVRKTSAVALREVAGDAAKPLLAQVVHDSAPTVGMAAAGQLLASGDIQYLNDLERAVQAPSPEIRAAAIEALGYWRDPRATELLRVGLRDRNPAVRSSAALQLARRGDRDAIPVLKQMIARGDPPSGDPPSGDPSSQAALDELVKLGAVTPAELIRMARSSSPPSRIVALRAASTVLPKAQAATLLQRAIRDANAQVRRAAATQLGLRAKTEFRARLALQRLISDPDPTVRASAALVLARLSSGSTPSPPKPVRPAPLPTEPTLPRRGQAEARTDLKQPLWVEDSNQEASFKRASAMAAALELRGNLQAALGQLTRARQLKPGNATVQCELGRVYVKLALRHAKSSHEKSSRDQAQRYVSHAKQSFEACHARASAGPLAGIAERGLRDVERLAQRLTPVAPR